MCVSGPRRGCTDTDTGVGILDNSRRNVYRYVLYIHGFRRDVDDPSVGDVASALDSSKTISKAFGATPRTYSNTLKADGG
jgi:hypothetical protein